ncbi:MAG: cyclic nucleotide-binding domain-containing protein [Cellvibrionaceae bacterium]|nr:cyclic nucleotide-binding domain-containing protein [Cellvibrionaceae bacterium]
MIKTKAYLYQQCRSLVPLNLMREQHLLTALDGVTEQCYRKGDVLFDVDEPLSSLFYLLSGEVLLQHDQGRERIITADFHWLPIVQFQAEHFSALALTDCHLLKFNREDLDNLLTWSQVADYLEIDISYEREYDDDSKWMTAILNSNLFYKIPPLNVLSIYTLIDAIRVKAGDTILRQGDPGDYCYFIKSGKALVAKADSQQSPPKVIAEIGPGRCFGEDALIQQTQRNATVEMISDGVLMRLHQDNFKRLLIEPSISHIESQALEALQDQHSIFLDVRSQEEFDYRHIVNAQHIPLNLLRLKMRLLNPEKHYVVYCNSGVRSRAAAYLLEQKGYKITLLKGGLLHISEAQVDEFLQSEFDEYHRLAEHYTIDLPQSSLLS